MRNTPFYIARRYLISKKGSQAVSFITGLSAFAMMVAVAAMFIIVSVFSGLIVLNRQMIADVHADLTVSSAEGKQLPDLERVERVLRKDDAISHFSKVIEEKAYVVYDGKGEIVHLRGVDSAYTAVNPAIKKNVFYGHYPSFKYVNEAIMESQLDNRLSIPVNSSDQVAQILMPKPGVGLIENEGDIFNRRNFYTVGVFSSGDQLSNYVIAPIELAEQLLNLPRNSAYEVVVKLKDSKDAEQVQGQLESALGKDYVVKTKDEQNAAFWKMINTEKLMIYLIFGLVIFITTFNLAGAIIIIQLDKKEQARSLVAMGMSFKGLRRIYFNTGMLIVTFGIVSGLFVGTVVCWLQLKYGFFKATEILPFPVKIELKNYIIVALTALVFGILISWIFSHGRNRIKWS